MAHTEKCRGCRNENRCDFIHCTSEREKEIRAKAIEEFAEEILKNSQTANRSPFNNDYTVLIHKFVIDEIAEQLKGE